MRIRRTSLAMWLVLAGCGASATTDPSTTARASRPTVELSIRDPRGGYVHVGDLRGQVVIVVLLTTYDTMSHALLTDLDRIAVLRPDVAFIGVLVQPGADTLADAYVRALDPPFPMGFDPDDVLSSETSPLGRITTVPTLVSIDRGGHLVARREGYQSERIIEAMILEAESRAPEAEVAPPPLLGTPSAR